MEMLKKFKKKIVPIVLAVVIFATSVVSGPASLTAQAASVAVGEEFSVELAMLLYNIMETVAISSGIKDGLDDYESGATLYDAFTSFMDSIAPPGASSSWLTDTYVTLEDGTSITMQDALNAAGATDGSNALKLPKEEVFTKYRTISGGKNPENSPTPSPTPSGDDYVVLDKFHEIAFILVSSPMLAMFTKFFEVVLQGNIEGVDPAEYYGDYNSNLPVFDYSYLKTGSARFSLKKDNKTYVITPDPYLNSENEFYSFVYQFSSGDSDYFSLNLVRISGSRLYTDGSSFPCVLTNLSDGSVTTVTLGGFYLGDNCSLVTNIPFFKSFDSLKKFFNSYINNGLSGVDSSSLLNGTPYDYHSMTAAAPDTLENLSGTKLDPAKVPAMNNAMKEAANGVEATGTDKEANNAEMIAAVKAAVAEALAEAQPDPAPEPTAAPDPEPSTAPDPGTDTNYSGILGLILSAIKAIASGIWDFFCDPMGAITTGLTNLYNGVLRIIEIFPEQVQLVLGNIASLPSAMLQVFADPLGAIQSLLGALPSWANLQAYLDKILQALLDPVSALQPSDPGGTDPGGGDESGKHTPDLLSLLNGLILLIMILLMLLRIFLHCLQFIVGIFKIEASPGFLPDDMVLGLNYLKTLEITGIGMSVYDFMMGLIYIFMVFGVIKLLRGFAFHIHIPKGGSR